jgi:hypothetical protein
MNDDEELPRSSTVALTGYRRPRRPAWDTRAGRPYSAADLA